MDFHEILYWVTTLNSVYKIKVWLKSGKNNRHFSRRLVLFYDYFGY